MKKALVLLLSVITVLFGTVFPVYAAEETRQLLVDEYGLLTEEEQTALTSKLEEVSDRHGFDVVIWTVGDYTDWRGVFNDTSYGIDAIADDIFDYVGYGRGTNADGCLLLISMEDRSIYLSTSGYGLTAITDAGTDYIISSVGEYLGDENYPGAFDLFVTICDDFLTQAESGLPYDYDNISDYNPNGGSNIASSLLLSVAVGLIVAFISVSVMKGKLKTVRSKYSASDYVRSGSLDITTARDLFLYSHVDRRKRETGSGSRSGSSSHTSSSGRSHGGGGGHF